MDESEWENGKNNGIPDVPVIALAIFSPLFDQPLIFNL
jgi:hypothetical protein